MKVPIVMLVKLPGFSKVGSFTLKSKSRLSYANAHRPSLPRFLIISHRSFVSVLTMFAIEVMETHQPPWARTLMTHSGVFVDSKRNPCTAGRDLNRNFVLS